MVPKQQLQIKGAADGPLSERIEEVKPPPMGVMKRRRMRRRLREKKRAKARAQTNLR